MYIKFERPARSQNHKNESLQNKKSPFQRLALAAAIAFASTSSFANLGEFIDSSGQTFGLSGAKHTALADVDGDGDLDAVITTTGQTQTYLNDGTGVFSGLDQNLRHPSPSGTSTNQALLVDLDGDGDLDIFNVYGGTSINVGRPNIVRLNDGSGNFTDTGQLLGNGVSRSAVAGDFDGDGDIDVLVENQASAAGSVEAQNILWVNDGAGVFSSVTFPEPAEEAGMFSVADLDSDGDLDLVFAPAYAGSNEKNYYFYENDGSANFTQSTLFQAVGGFGANIGDLDGDGDLDLQLSLLGTVPYSQVWLNDGSAQFTVKADALDISNGIWNGFGTTLADFDNDGDLDLYRVHTDQGLWFNDGTGRYVKSSQIFSPYPSGNFGAPAGDVDGDGDLDLLTTNNSGNKIWFNAGEPPADTDGDGVLDVEDNCPNTFNDIQFDLDGDGFGDACDNDDDADGIDDLADLCPRVASSNLDFDQDGIDDNCDADANGDGFKYDPAFSAGFDISAAAPISNSWNVERAVDGLQYYIDADTRLLEEYVIDSAGKEHIVTRSFISSGKDRLNFYYASKDLSGQWNEELVRAATLEELGASLFAGSRSQAALAVDPTNGDVHALLNFQTGRDETGFFAAQKNLSLTYYAVKTGGQWQVAELPEMLNAFGSTIDIEVDSAGLVHVTFVTNGRQGAYLTYDGFTWTQSIFGSAFFLDMKLGTDGIARVVNPLSGGSGVNYVELDPTHASHSTQNVFDNGANPHGDAAFEYAGYNASIELDSANNAYIMYTNNPGQLGYSTLIGGIWNNFALPASAPNDRYGFVVDTAGNPKVIYNGSFSGQSFPSYVNELSFDGVSWVDTRISGDSMSDLDVQANLNGEVQIAGSIQFGASGADWQGIIDRPYNGRIAPWRGVAVLAPTTPSTETVVEQSYVMLANSAASTPTNREHFVLSFDDDGKAQTMYPEDLDVYYSNVICTSSPCPEGVQELFDQRHAAAISSIEESSGAMALGDFDNDGLTDYIAIGQDTNFQTIVEFQKKASKDINLFASRIIDQAHPLPATIVTTLGGAYSNYVDAAVADFNGDANMDLLVTDAGSSSVLVFLGNGDATFQTPITLSTAFTPAGIDSEDINSDGKADFVVASSDDAGKVEIFIGEGDGTFVQSTMNLTSNGSSEAGISLADFDRDQKVDMVLSNMTSGLSFYKGFGDGSFSTSVVTSLNQELAGVSTQLRGIDNDYLNQDIHMDIILTDAASNAVYTLVWQGDGQFTVLDQQNARYIDFQNNACSRLLDKLSGEYAACLADPTKVEFVPYLAFGEVAPKGIATFPYFDLVSPAQPLAPIADAGADQSTNVGTVVTLDGALSNDPDEYYPLSYEWEIISAPTGSTATIIDTTSVSTSLVTDVPGEYTVRLIVTDATGVVSEADTVLISTFNTVPTAYAGDDQSISLIDDLVQLDGSQSNDADGDDIEYSWSFVQKPEGSVATLSDVSAVSPTFVADVNGDYVLSLVVNDPWNASEADPVVISFNNLAPVAVAGNNLSIIVGGSVSLDGSASFDANGDALTYDWGVVSVPAESSAIEPSTSSSLSFTADVAGEYILSLVVSDGIVTSTASNVTVVAIGLQQAMSIELQEAIDLINGFDDSQLMKKADKTRSKLTRRLSITLKIIDKGNYADAKERLESLLGKIDGCASASTADKQDWITECSAQTAVYTRVVSTIALLDQALSN